MNDANRRVVLVTGAGTGVGRACALRFAKLGYDVVVNYSRSEAEASETAQAVEACGVKASLIRCDVSNDHDVREMIGQVNQTFGQLDVLVNNAATTNFVEHRDLEALTEAMWDRMLAVNLKGAFFVTRAAANLLRSEWAGSGGEHRFGCRNHGKRLFHRILCLQGRADHDDQIVGAGACSRSDRQRGLSRSDRQPLDSSGQSKLELGGDGRRLSHSPRRAAR